MNRGRGRVVIHAPYMYLLIIQVSGYVNPLLPFPKLSPSCVRLCSPTYAGCGVNVSNKHPTISLNDAIALHNKDTGSSLSPMREEQLLALTYNRLEVLLGQYETFGLEGVVENLYYKYWLHRYVVW